MHCESNNAKSNEVRALVHGGSQRRIPKDHSVVSTGRKRVVMTRVAITRKGHTEPADCGSMIFESRSGLFVLWFMLVHDESVRATLLVTR